MNLLQLRNLVREYTGTLSTDPDPTNAEINAALNRAQRVYCFLTLAYEEVSAFTLNPGNIDQPVFAQLPRFIAPLRMIYEGRRLQKLSLQGLGALDPRWPGNVERPRFYSQVGPGLFFFSGVPAAAIALTLHHAAFAPDVTNDGTEFGINPDRHRVLAGAATALVRLKEGGQHYPKTLDYLGEFVRAIAEDALRARIRAQQIGYDTTPPQIAVDKVLKTMEKLASA